MAEFSESLDSLWAVQKHDREIVRAQESIAKAERDIAAAQKKLDDAQTDLDARRETARKLHSEHKELEAELQRLDARVKQLEAQGTEAGMEAATKQRAHIDELEMKGLDLITAVATAEGEVEASEAALAGHQSAFEAVEKAAQEVVRTAEAAIEAQQNARAGAIEHVVPELLQVYDEVNARHPGKALCHIDGEFCAGCQAELRQQLIVQVKARAEILRCPNCLRILDV
ncbi:MAG: hypothetical protein KDB82_01930 [Planctomycetes bacterium]|nr:hypothetical protein [Planctomycetota bacterium]